MSRSFTTYYEPMGSPPRIRTTLSALLVPRRLAPIVVVAGTLVWAQAAYNEAPHRVPLAIALCTAFVLVAPVAWRTLFFVPSAALHALVLWVIYLTIAVGTVSSLGLYAPRFLHMQTTLMTQPRHLVVCVVLFVVGGWGLGRHIALETHVAQLAQRTEETQLLALRAQLDPHFLFNTLNAIAEWCVLDGEVAERAVLQLSSMLRTVLAGVREPTWLLAEELELARSLCALHRLRDPELFELRVTCAGDLQAARVPPMLLLPLFENAMKHGPMAGHRGLVELDVRCGEDLSVVLSNPGRYRGPRAGSDGLPTLERRLALVYAHEARFSIQAVGPRTRVELHVPARPRSLVFA